MTGVLERRFKVHPFLGCSEVQNAESLVLKRMLPRKIWVCAIDRGYDVNFGCHGIVMSTDTNTGCGILTNTNTGTGCGRALVPKKTRSSDYFHVCDRQLGCGDVYVHDSCYGYGYG